MRTPVSVPLTGMRTPTLFTSMFSRSAHVHAHIAHSMQRHRCLSFSNSYLTSGLPGICNDLCVCRFYVLLGHFSESFLQFFLSHVLTAQGCSLPFIFLMSLQKLLQNLVSKGPPCLVTVFALVSLHLSVDSGSLSLATGGSLPLSPTWLKGPGAFPWGLTQ